MIRVASLVKKFGDCTAVDKFSFEVPKGDFCVPRTERRGKDDKPSRYSPRC